MKKKYTIISILFLICLIGSVVLTAKPTPAICESGCEVVQISKYSQTFGIKNSLYAIPIFSVLLILSLIQIKKQNQKIKKVIKISTIIGSIIALYFIFLQIFVLNAYCTYCLVVDVGILLALTFQIKNGK